MRGDTCLNPNGTVQPRYEWNWAINGWEFRECVVPPPPVCLPFPDWLKLGGALMPHRDAAEQVTGKAPLFRVFRLMESRKLVSRKTGSPTCRLA
jgi:hypothetical protein